MMTIKQLAERYPDPFEACLLLDYDNRLSVGCWISIDEENREGSFRWALIDDCNWYDTTEVT